MLIYVAKKYWHNNIIGPCVTGGLSQVTTTLIRYDIRKQMTSIRSTQTFTGGLVWWFEKKLAVFHLAATTRQFRSYYYGCVGRTVGEKSPGFRSDASHGLFALLCWTRKAYKLFQACTYDGRLGFIFFFLGLIFDVAVCAMESRDC